MKTNDSELAPFYNVKSAYERGPMQVKNADMTRDELSGGIIS